MDKKIREKRTEKQKAHTKYWMGKFDEHECGEINWLLSTTVYRYVLGMTHYV
jgi:hypothetical protein